jgi:hypothetical protein
MSCASSERDTEPHLIPLGRMTRPTARRGAYMLWRKASSSQRGFAALRLRSLLRRQKAVRRPASTLSGDELSRSSEDRLFQLLAATDSNSLLLQPLPVPAAAIVQASPSVGAGKIGRQIALPTRRKPDRGVVHPQALRQSQLPSLTPSRHSSPASSATAAIAAS